MTVRVHVVAATRDIAGPMLMKSPPTKVTGGVTLKKQVSMRKKEYGKYAR